VTSFSIFTPQNSGEKRGVPIATAELFFPREGGGGTSPDCSLLSLRARKKRRKKRRGAGQTAFILLFPSHHSLFFMGPWVGKRERREVDAYLTSLFSKLGLPQRSGWSAKGCSFPPFFLPHRGARGKGKRKEGKRAAGCLNSLFISLIHRRGRGGGASGTRKTVTTHVHCPSLINSGDWNYRNAARKRNEKKKKKRGPSAVKVFPLLLTSLRRVFPCREKEGGEGGERKTNRTKDILLSILVWFPLRPEKRGEGGRKEGRGGRGTFFILRKTGKVNLIPFLLLHLLILRFLPWADPRRGGGKEGGEGGGGRESDQLLGRTTSPPQQSTAKRKKEKKRGGRERGKSCVSKEPCLFQISLRLARKKKGKGGDRAELLIRHPFNPGSMAEESRQGKKERRPLAGGP